MAARLNIELLEAFVEVVKTGSFTRAGEILHRTQPCVSMQVRRLEENVGNPLIKRDSKSITLTGRGEALYEYASNIVTLSKEAYQRVSSPELTGIARIGIPEWYAKNEFQTILCRFARAHPQVKLEMHVGDSAMLHDLLDTGMLDIALAIRNPDKPDRPRIWQEPLYWATGKDFPITDPVPLVLFSVPCPYRKLAETALDDQGRTWSEVFTSTSVAAVRVALESGLGISILPAGAITPSLRILRVEDGFVDLPPTELSIYTRDKKMPRTIRFLDKYLSEHVRAAILEKKH